MSSATPSMPDVVSDAHVRDLPQNDAFTGPSNTAQSYFADSPIDTQDATQDRVLPPEESMNATLPKASQHLDEALIALSGGQLQSGLAHIEETAALLDNLLKVFMPMEVGDISTGITNTPENISEPAKIEKPRAMAAAA